MALMDHLTLWQLDSSLSVNVLNLCWCGDTPQAYQRPFLGDSWAPTQIYLSGPFWGSAQHQAESKLTNHRTVYSDQSQNSLFWPITGQFILTNHRTVYSDQSQMTHQHSGPNKRRWLGPVKSVNLGLGRSAHRSTTRCIATCTTRRAINIVNCWSAVVIIHKQPCSIPHYRSITSMAAKWPWAERDEIILVMKSGWHISLIFLRHWATKYSSGLL